MIKTYIVDSFTNQAFKGNPAGVCLLNHPLSEKRMLQIAQELNLSETAFVQKKTKAETYQIRYFSPKMEIPLCGHATLAAAKVIVEQENLEAVSFTTIQQIHLKVTKVGHELLMEFPVYETHEATVPDALLKALGLETIVDVRYNEETNILLLAIEDTQLLAELSPDFSALYQSHDSINGVLVTASSADGEYDFHSRYFWPWSGTNEDPATGGTHTFLAKYWSEKLGKNKMKSFQSSERTGAMDVELLGENKLLIKSEAVIVFEGHLVGAFK